MNDRRLGEVPATQLVGERPEGARMRARLARMVQQTSKPTRGDTTSHHHLSNQCLTVADTFRRDP